uniref:Uncharacterized protein n=1 Tax=Tanacetum cinerariifolium TaxID=118510 RepID=A0A699II62_TANCI|nr:hypothetical protein [Tanacetum cinerariifolium]
MGEPLSLDRVFEFPKDELEPHLAYDFFAYEPLPGYAGNPNNNNRWIEADAPLLGELGVVADEPMVGPIVDEIAKPIVKAEEQMITLEEEVWEVNEEWLMALVTPLSMLAVPSPSVYEAGGLEYSLGNLKYEHRQLVQKVIYVSDAEVASDRFEQIGSGFAGNSAAEGFADPVAADYCFRDEQSGEHIDAVHY